MDREARRARREARRPELRLAAPAARLVLAALVAGCASVGDPPGGPPDTTPPTVARVSPDSGAVVAPPSEADIYLDEVVQERVAAPRPDIASAVLLSPVTGAVDVGWHRDRISVRPHDGFKAGRIYRLQLLPVLSDLRQNRMRRGRVWVFSTGPAIPSATLEGAVVDWAGNRPAANALIEAVLLPDSLPYRTLADSAGGFTLGQMPPGEYLLFGTIDQNNDRRRGPREAFDTVRVHLADSASAELFAFTHDTTGPRLRTVELADSVTLRITFDRPLDPSRHLDTGAVRLALATDSTTPLPVLAVWTQAEADSARAALAAQRAAADSAEQRLRADSAAVRPPPDTARGHAPGDTARAARAQPTRGERPAVPPPPLAVPTGRTGAGTGTTARRDSTRAAKMLARRPAPTAVRLVRLPSPLREGARYILWVRGARDLSGVAADARGQVAVPVPRAPRGARTPAAGDSLRPRADTTATRGVAADSMRPPAAAPPDTARAALPARRDSTPPPPPPSRTRRGPAP